jgi:glucosamine-6-phosphate deaminase
MLGSSVNRFKQPGIPPAREHGSETLMTMTDHARLVAQPQPNIKIFATASDAADAVSAHMLAKMTEYPQAVLGLATGQTPRRVYAKLIEAVDRGSVSFRLATTFNLDEYCGLPASHPDSFAAFMRRELFDQADFTASRINLIDGDAKDSHAESVRYANLLKANGPIDLQLLGLGTNGHIGFNEPGSAHTSRVRIVELSEETLLANQPSLLACDTVPLQAITMGIADILEAREIIMLATGAAKAQAVRRSLEENATADCPGSYLSAHGNVHWYLDADAASGLAAQS